MFRAFAFRAGSDAVVLPTVSELPRVLSEPDTILWVDLSEPVEEVDRAVARDVFKFHPLALEDCFETRTHPKVDEYDGYLYLITHGLTAGASAESAEVVELDAFLGPRYLVTHHSVRSRSVAAVSDLVERTGYPLRQGPGAVLHAILDRQVDGIETVLDSIEERIEDLEAAVFAHPHDSHIAAVLSVKRNILGLRRWTAKQREVLLRLGRREFPLVTPGDTFLFRDVHDRLIRINDLLEGYRDMLTSIQDAYLSAVSNRTNEIMKFLTLFTSTMMPLTVVTGIYGMNFEHMPELRSVLGYPAVLGVMAALTGTMLLYFRRRGWLGKRRRADDTTEMDIAPRREERS